jgi:ribonuclease P protein component
MCRSSRPIPSSRKNSFSRLCRVRRRREYQKVQFEGARFSTRQLVILWEKNQLEVTRLGVTVSRKVAKQACRRNRIKRWIREAFRRLARGNPNDPFIDMVVIARPPMLEASFRVVEETLTRFWKQRSIHGPEARGSC